MYINECVGIIESISHIRGQERTNSTINNDDESFTEHYIGTGCCK